jgi:hypothetical protein
MGDRSVSSDDLSSAASIPEVDIDILVKDIVAIHSSTEISLSFKYNLIKNYLISLKLDKKALVDVQLNILDKFITYLVSSQYEDNDIKGAWIVVLKNVSLFVVLYYYCVFLNLFFNQCIIQKFCHVSDEQIESEFDSTRREFDSMIINNIYIYIYPKLYFLLYFSR